MEVKLPKLPLFLVELCLIMLCWNYLWRAVICLGLWVLVRALGELRLLSCSVSDLLGVSGIPVPHLLGTIEAAIHSEFDLFFGTYKAGDRHLHIPNSKGAGLIWQAFLRQMHPKVKTSRENEYLWDGLEMILTSAMSSGWVCRWKKRWPFLGSSFSMCHLVLHFCLMAAGIGGIFFSLYVFRTVESNWKC